MTRADARGHRREDIRAARRVQLLDDAVEAIRELGAGATMEQLARRGGVTKPILYRHFRDRDGLITAIADRFSAELLEEIQTALRESDAPEDLVYRTIDAYLGFIEREPNLYRFIIQQVTSRTSGALQISPLIDAIAREVAVVIGEQLRAAGADSGAAVPWAYGIVGMVHQAGDWWLDDRTLPRSGITTYLANLLWGGLGAAADQPDGTATR